MTKRVWTDEQRDRLREEIQYYKPWEKSTGPKSAEGKAAVSKNADQGRLRPQLRALSRTLRASGLTLADITVKAAT